MAEPTVAGGGGLPVSPEPDRDGRGRTSRWPRAGCVAGPSEILVKYEDFTGRAVLHCHNLKHGDLGMVQVVDYVAA